MSVNVTKMAVAMGAMLLAAACSSDGTSSFGGGGGGGGSTSTVSALGVTGEGGVTDTLGLASLTDPLLGTEGVLGGGDEGVVGGQLPPELTEALAPVASGLAPVTDALNQVPLDMVLGQVPSLGLGGEDGLVADLTGQDVTGMLLGDSGTVPGLVGGGEEGALGSLVPGGALPGLPGGGEGGDPLAPVTDLLGGLAGGGEGGDPLAPVTDLLGGGLPGGDGGDPLAPVTDLVGGLAGAGGGDGSDPLAPVTGLLDTVTGGLPTP